MLYLHITTPLLPSPLSLSPLGTSTSLLTPSFNLSVPIVISEVFKNTVHLCCLTSSHVTHTLARPIQGHPSLCLPDCLDMHDAHFPSSASPTSCLYVFHCPSASVHLSVCVTSCLFILVSFTSFIFPLVSFAMRVI